MKIFVLNPLIYSKKKSIIPVRPRQPLSLAYIASLFLNRGYDLKLLDANVLGYNVDRTVKEIKKYNPDILVLTSTQIDRWECPTSHIDSVFEVINKAVINPTILTGSHGSLTPEWVFKKCNNQFIVRGEPEIIVLNLVETLAKNKDIGKVKGISYKINNKIVHNKDASRIENLDDLPFPAYHLLPMERYKYSFPDLLSPFSIMLTSRGCPFSCKFCLKAMSKGKYITRNPENIVKEIEYLIKDFNIKSIFFQDWEFTINKERIKEICDLILKKNLKIVWGCNSRANDLSHELIDKMKKAGCVRINIGFESGSQKVLDKINKGIKIKDLENVIKLCRANNMNIGMYAMLNLPGETKETIKETVDFFVRNKIESMTPNLAIPYFGTALFERLKAIRKEGKFNWDNIERSAGRIDVKQSPKMARFYYHHFRFKSKFGPFYFFHPGFYKRAIAFIKNKIK